MKGAVVEKTWIGVLENTGLGTKRGAAGWVTKVNWDMRNVGLMTVRFLKLLGEDCSNFWRGLAMYTFIKCENKRLPVSLSGLCIFRAGAMALWCCQLALSKIKDATHRAPRDLCPGHKLLAVLLTPLIGA